MIPCNIKRAGQVLNLDDIGTIFKSSVLRRKLKSLGSKGQNVLKTAVRRKNNHHITVVSVVLAFVFVFKPCVVYPSIQAHYRSMNGLNELLNDLLMSFYLYQREKSAVDRSVF